jgi:exoribonuclease-2
MIQAGALVVYKTKPALVKEITGDKFSISICGGSPVKVRDKDFELIHPGPVNNLNDIEQKDLRSPVIRESWELLSDEEKGGTLSLKELASFIYGEYTPSAALAVHSLLLDGLYFSGVIEAIAPREKNEVMAEETKRNEKQRDAAERSQFLDRVKACLKKNGESSLLSEDSRFMQDIEALAYGKSLKSRTMKDLGLGETPEDAHSLLLKTGFWNTAVNPHPSRYGVSLAKACVKPDAPASNEQRRDLCHLAAFAIDSPWSHDPDDAVSIDGDGALYVHVADPSASVAADSPAEKEARDRGATLYLPETTVRMLSDEFLPVFALGLSETSPALTFKMTVNENGEVLETEIFPSMVKVRRMSYEEADNEMEKGGTEEAKALCALYDLAEKIYKRRTECGAINIELPETHISVKDGVVEILPINRHRSSFTVKECMIIAGEGAGRWASGKGLAFPYLCQEAELPEKVLGGFAGSMQLRKSMRTRVLSTKPGRHEGLGLDTYTQVTSPLRRYTDLLAHIQIRAYLRGNAPLSADEVMAHVSAGEAASIASVHAERASRAHWTMVYLEGKKDSIWDAVAVENKGNRWLTLIPSLSLETQAALNRNAAPNDNVKLILKSVNIPRGEANFAMC